MKQGSQHETRARRGALDIETLFSIYGKLSAAVGLSFGALASAAPAQAEDMPVAPPEDKSGLKEVVVTAPREAPEYKAQAVSSPKFTQPLLDLPQSITVVPKEVLTQQNAQNLQDILKNVPGITFTSGEGNLGWGDMFTIRGFSSEQSLTVDGVRDAGMSSRNDTFNLEQVEVFKGTGSIESGVSAIGGSVNLVSKEARLDDFYHTSFGVGSAGYTRFTADLNHQLDATSALRLNLMKQQNHVAERDMVKYDRQGIAASLGLGLGTRTRIFFDVFHQDDDNIPDTGLPIQRGTGGSVMPYVSRNAWYGSTTYTQQTTTDALTARVEHDFSDAVKIRNQTRWERADNLSVLSPARFNAANSAGASLGTSLGYAGSGSLTAASGILSYSDFTNTANRYGVLRGNDFGTSKRYTILDNQSDLSLKFDTGAIRHELSTGVDLYRETYGDLPRTVATPSGALWFDMSNPTVSSASVATLKGGAGVESRVTNAGLYVADTMKFSPQWQFLTALRYDRWKAVTSTRGATTASSSAGALSGRLGLVYKPLENASLYLTYARAAQPSALGATTNNAIYGSASASAYSPAVAKTRELGGKWDVLNKRLALTGAVFRTEVTDSWEYGDDETSPVRALPAKRVDGVELGVQGNLTDAWSVFGGLTRLKSKQTKGANAGSQAKNVPDWTLNLWTSYEAKPGLFFSYGAQYVGKRRYSDNKYVGGLNNSSSTVSGPSGTRPVYVLDQEKAPAYWLHSLAARWRVDRRLALNFNVDNLFNKFYWSRIGSSLDGFQLYGVPGAGRTYTLSADISF
ncbi:TonB-dependent receptor [Herbaspirillum seropedicae]|uniref:TonB-dependent receptor n=1 Tax=Herbaspirillum seropedicae TaxID=964 RepID=UPI0015E058EC|nr:TonB-dependent siderophore receptor [Herbaspirillum seropedicae]